MTKKLIAGLVVFMVCSFTNVSQAYDVQPPSLAILDTGIRQDHFKNNIIHEVCIIEWSSCPNGKQFMEGEGAATLSEAVFKARGFDHGTAMAASALYVNPDLKIVFIRIIGNDSRGNRQGVSPNYLAKAFDWVATNASRFNIKAVSISQGHHRLLYGKSYCPTSYAVNGTVSRLLSKDIPIFAASGNIADKKRIDWPACIANVISVSSKDKFGNVSSFSNYDFNLTDILEIESINSVVYGYWVKAMGTSVSTQIAASKYIKEKVNG